MLDFGFYNADCMDYMKEFPDNYFQLAIIDPPYGEGLNAEAGGSKGWFTKYNQKVTVGADKNIQWNTKPDDEYFKELFRISQNQVIWGGNYFTLPPSRCFLVWRKLSISESFTMAMCEYAWTSFDSNAKVFEHTPQGTKHDERFHPTQKPVELYKWILNNYAKPDDIILDTHVGSGSSLIACHKTGHKYVGFEIDEYYYKKAKERIERETAQVNFFDMGYELC